MDNESGTATEHGGSVEPADRASIAKARAQTPVPRGETYELRDPFAEVTYREPTMKAIVAHADRLDASRIVAVGPDGSRTPIHRVGNGWERQPTLRPQPPAPEQAVADEPAPKAGAKDAGRSETAASREQAERLLAARVAELDSALQERYHVKRSTVQINNVPVGTTEYRYLGDVQRVAFTATAFRLSTESDNPSVARSMVDVAEMRNWKALRVNGSQEFRRQVWLEATVRDVRVLGYDPDRADQQLVQREREARQRNRVEPVRDTSASSSTTAEAPKAKGTSGRGGGRKAVLVALEAVLVERKVPAKQRAAVMAVAEQTLAQRLRNGETHKVKVFDPEAPSARTTQQQTQERSRGRSQERTLAPGHAAATRPEPSPQHTR
jgi:hypothetical protein